jgi:hypothetical protein
VPPKYIYRDATYLRPVRGNAGGVNVADPAAAALTTSEMAYRWGCHAKPSLSLDPPMGLAEWRWGQVILIVGLWACCSCWSAQLFLLGFRSGLSADGSGWRG